MWCSWRDLAHDHHQAGIGGYSNTHLRGNLEHIDLLQRDECHLLLDASTLEKILAHTSILHNHVV